MNARGCLWTVTVVEKSVWTHPTAFAKGQLLFFFYSTNEGNSTIAVFVFKVCFNKFQSNLCFKLFDIYCNVPPQNLFYGAQTWQDYICATKSNQSDSLQKYTLDWPFDLQFNHDLHACWCSRHDVASTLERTCFFSTADRDTEGQSKLKSMSELLLGKTSAGHFSTKDSYSQLKLMLLEASVAICASFSSIIAQSSKQ